MLLILPVCVLHPEFIQHKVKYDFVGSVFPKRRGVAHWFITIFFKTFLQVVVGKFYCLLQYRHSLLNFDINPTVAPNEGQCILIYDFLRH